MINPCKNLLIISLNLLSLCTYANINHKQSTILFNPLTKIENSLEIIGVKFVGGIPLSPLIRKDIIDNYHGVFNNINSQDKYIVITYQNNRYTPIQITNISINSIYWKLTKHNCPNTMEYKITCEVTIEPQISLINQYLNSHYGANPGDLKFSLPIFNNDSNFHPGWRDGHYGNGKPTQFLKPYIQFSKIAISSEFKDNVYTDNNDSCPRSKHPTKTKRIIYSINLTGIVPNNINFLIEKQPIFFKSKLLITDEGLTCKVIKPGHLFNCTIKIEPNSFKPIYRIIETSDEETGDHFLKHNILAIDKFTIIDNEHSFFAAVKEKSKEIPILTGNSLNGTVVTKIAGNPRPYLCGLKQNGDYPDLKTELKPFDGNYFPKTGEVTYIRALNKTYPMMGHNGTLYKIDHLVVTYATLRKKFFLYGCNGFSAECPILINYTPDSQFNYKIRYISEPVHNTDSSIYFYLAYERTPETEKQQSFFEYKLENRKIYPMPRLITTDWNHGFWINDILTIEGKATDKDYLQVSATFRGWGWISEATQVFYCKIYRYRSSEGSTYCGSFGGNIRPPSNWTDNAKIVHNPGNTTSMFVFDKINPTYCAAKYTKANFISNGVGPIYNPFPRMIGDYYRCDGDTVDIVPLDGSNIVFAINTTNEVYSMRNDRTMSHKVKFDKEIRFGTPYWPGNIFYVNK